MRIIRSLPASTELLTLVIATVGLTGHDWATYATGVGAAMNWFMVK